MRQGIKMEDEKKKAKQQGTILISKVSTNLSSEEQSKHTTIMSYPPFLL
jgi:hypothetical protein